MAPHELRVNAIQRPAFYQMRILVVNEEQHANGQKQAELEEYYQPARQQRAAAFRLMAGAQQALHHELIGAMAGHGEKATTHQASPERILLGEELHRWRKRKIETVQLAAPAGPRGQVHPTPGDL